MLVVLIILVSLTLLGAVIERAFFYIPSNDTGNIFLPNSLKNLAKAAIKQNDPISPLYPKRLIIPAIKINAKFQYVGVTYAGNMATPNNFSDVGWYKYGPMPGQDGSAVVAGHVNDGLALPAVFWNLNKLKTGDDIYIERVNGTKIHFVVTGQAVYDYNSPTTEIFSGSNHPLLKLITCTGTWISAINTHNERLVVTAEEVP